MNNRIRGICVLLVCGLVGCAPVAAPSGPTRVLPEGDVKVKVDDQGHPQVGSAPVAPAPTAESK